MNLVELNVQDDDLFEIYAKYIHKILEPVIFFLPIIGEFFSINRYLYFLLYSSKSVFNSLLILEIINLILIIIFFELISIMYFIKMIYY